VATPLQEVHLSGLIWFKSISKFVLGGIRIGMGYMNLVTVISIIMYVVGRSHVASYITK